MRTFLPQFLGPNATPFPLQDRVCVVAIAVCPHRTRFYIVPLATMTKQKEKKQTLYTRLRKRWRQNYAIARRVTFTPIERPRRREYSVSPVFDIVLIVLLVILGLGLLL